MMNEMRYTEIAYGAWAGQMVGDALGASVEGWRGANIMARHPQGLATMLPNSPIFGYRPAGSVTDDTQMALCLHRSLKDAGGWSPQAAMARYIEWFRTNPPDVGCATRSALMGYPMPESQGNGTLMRVMPLALWAVAHPGFDWESAVREDAALTHPNPNNADCNAVFVYAMLQAMEQGATPQSVYKATLAWARLQSLSPEVINAVEEAASVKPVCDLSHSGWVVLALHVALYQLLHAKDFRSALIDVVSSGGDTDTNAAITGALLGTMYGVGSIPVEWLDSVRVNNPADYVNLLPPT